MHNAESFDDALTCAIRFIKFRPRSVLEVREKLALKDYSGAIIDKIIKYLTETSLLNDEDFAKMWVNERVLSKSIGPVKIKSELKQKGISNNIIQDVVERAYAENDETFLAERVIKKKYRNNLDNIDYKKAINLLIRNGFSYSVSQRAVKKIKDSKFQETDTLEEGKIGK